MYLIAFPFLEIFIVRGLSVLQHVYPLGISVFCGCVVSFPPPVATKTVATAQLCFMGRQVNRWPDTTSQAWTRTHRHTWALPSLEFYFQ